MTVIASLLSTLALAMPQAGPPRVPVAVLIVAGDEARHGQSRYVEFLVDKVGDENGWVELARPPVGTEGFESCQDDHEPERCLRFYVKASRETAGDAWPNRPPLVVVWVGNAEGEPPQRSGSARVICVGVGDAASNPEKQTIQPWPNAARVHPATPFMEDRQAMANCIMAAGAESGW